jgi:hypothetical protein
MAYDRYDTRDQSREDRSRWSDDRNSDRWRSADRRDPQDRGFFERAGDEIASWFGDDDAERRRREDQQRYGSERGHGRDLDRDWNDNRGAFARGGSSESDYNRNWRGELSGGRDGRFRDRGRDYRPMTGDYGRSERGYFGDRDRGDYDRSQSPWGRDEYRSTSRAGTSDPSDRSRHEDPHYRSWRDRHMNELDRDYDDYRRENQSKFESDFGSWRERRQQKRGLLGQIREHMEVVGNDDQHVGTVDKVAGDRLILTKSDPESGGAHHSLSCSEIDRIEGDRIILDCSADQARNRWRDESRSRALFERDEQGEMGPRMLDRSFEGTYR